jgi:hypothetical protein
MGCCRLKHNFISLLAMRAAGSNAFCTQKAPVRDAVCAHDVATVFTSLTRRKDELAAVIESRCSYSLLRLVSPSRLFSGVRLQRLVT